MNLAVVDRFSRELHVLEFCAEFHLIRKEFPLEAARADAQEWVVKEHLKCSAERDQSSRKKTIVIPTFDEADTEFVSASEWRIESNSRNDENARDHPGSNRPFL